MVNMLSAEKTKKKEKEQMKKEKGNGKAKNITIISFHASYFFGRFLSSARKKGKGTGK